MSILLSSIQFITMVDTFLNEKKEKINYLKGDCVVDLHDLLSKNTHLLEDMDPVTPPGIKNVGMLESAITRQTTGSGDYYKYPDPFSNAATLMYGVIKNHAFHNGNKRTGLLTLIKHLYVNGYVLKPSLNSKVLYNFLIAIADSNLKNFNLKSPKKERFMDKEKDTDWDIEKDIRCMAFWIKKNSAPRSKTLKGEIKVSTLKKTLQSKNIEVEQKGNKIEVYVKENSFFRKILSSTNKRSYTLLNKTEISKGQLSKLRKEFGLTMSDGIDNTFFYDDDVFLDSEIKTYKTIIYKLSKT